MLEFAEKALDEIAISIEERAERGNAFAVGHIRKRYWGQRFWGRGYFSTTSGNITDDIIMRYLDRHIRKDGFSPSS